MLLFIGTYFISMLPFAAAARYRVPVIPFLLLFGAVGIDGIGRFSLQREWNRAAFWRIAGVLLYIVFSINYSGFQPAPEKWHYDLALAYQNGGDFDPARGALREIIKSKN